MILVRYIINSKVISFNKKPVLLNLNEIKSSKIILRTISMKRHNSETDTCYFIDSKVVTYKKLLIHCKNTLVILFVKIFSRVYATLPFSNIINHNSTLISTQTEICKTQSNPFRSLISCNINIALYSIDSRRKDVANLLSSLYKEICNAGT